jgi:hypothetical protein
MSVTRSSTSLFALVIVLAACDGPPPVIDPDAGPPDAGTDAGPPDGGPPLTCTETMAVDGVLDDTVTVMLDTTMTETRPRDLGLGCGNVDGELRWAPQEVIELHVPGTGEVQVELDTVFEGDTDAEFNTVLQVRETCETVPSGTFPPTCFDDVSPEEFRTRGGFIATGGDTLFIIVTGYSEPPAEQGTVDSGRVRLDITVSASSAPTLTAGTLLLALDDTLISATGTDSGADARGVALNFYGPGGALLDIYGDGEATEDGDVFLVFFDPEPDTADFTGNAIVRGADVNLAGYLRAVAVGGQARFRVFDAVYAMSDPLMVPIMEAMPVGEGEACGGDRVCRPEMSCVADVCAATGAVATACGGAIALDVPLDGTMPLIQMGTTGAGLGNFAPATTCVPDPQGAIGAETIYAVTIPADTTADLIATTNLTGTGTTDTIVYVRSACPDSGTVLACNDDRAGGDVQSDIYAPSLTAGTYFIFVERYGGLMSGTIPHALSVTLRPVLAPGAACDPANMANRCATGTCPAGTDSVCPAVP